MNSLDELPVNDHRHGHIDYLSNRRFDFIHRFLEFNRSVIGTGKWSGMARCSANTAPFSYCD
jgi:hypothetical protein